MKLKTLAALVCLALAAQFVLSLFNALYGHYLTGMQVVQLLLSIPMILFFFFVWRRQKP